MLRYPSALLALLATGCGFLDAGTDLVVEAHRGAAAYWPQNSRAAMLGSIAEGFEGLEFDLALTADHVPVLSHDPWLHEDLCTTADGALLDERIYIQDLDLDTLLADYLCGGEPDPENPEAEVVAEEVMTFDELLVALADADPDMVVHIDVKYEPGMSPGPEVFAEEILSRWFAADLPNPWYVSANLGEALRAFRARGAELGETVPTSLIWPRFPPDGSDTAVALSSELQTLLGVQELVHLARAAEADGLAIPYQVLDRHAVEVARAEGLSVHVWTVNDPDLMARFQRWPLDGIITDRPREAR